MSPKLLYRQVASARAGASFVCCAGQRSETRNDDDDDDDDGDDDDAQGAAAAAAAAAAADDVEDEAAVLRPRDAAAARANAYCYVDVEAFVDDECPMELLASQRLELQHLQRRVSTGSVFSRGWKKKRHLS